MTAKTCMCTSTNRTAVRINANDDYLCADCGHAHHGTFCSCLLTDGDQLNVFIAENVKFREAIKRAWIEQRHKYRTKDNSDFAAYALGVMTEMMKLLPQEDQKECFKDRTSCPCCHFPLDAQGKCTKP